jgi:hypothetical protein
MRWRNSFGSPDADIEEDFVHPTFKGASMARDHLTRKQQQTLQTVADYRALTAKQLATLTDRAEVTARKSLTKLQKVRQLRVWPGPLGQSDGRPPGVYTLTEDGIRQLRAKKLISRDVADDRILVAKSDWLAHQLVLNWCHIFHRLLLDACDDLEGHFLSSTSPFLDRQDHALQTSDRRGRFLPDAVFGLASRQRAKHLLFYLEIDMDTESTSSRTNAGNNLTSKIDGYRSHFSSGGFHYYEKEWSCRLQGFRLLFVTSTERRAALISRLSRDLPDTEFVWVTDQRQLQAHGLTGHIWHRGGRTDHRESILGAHPVAEALHNMAHQSLED